MDELEWAKPSIEYAELWPLLLVGIDLHIK